MFKPYYMSIRMNISHIIFYVSCLKLSLFMYYEKGVLRTDNKNYKGFVLSTRASTELIQIYSYNLLIDENSVCVSLLKDLKI